MDWGSVFGSIGDLYIQREQIKAQKEGNKLSAQAEIAYQQSVTAQNSSGLNLTQGQMLLLGGSVVALVIALVLLRQ